MAASGLTVSAEDSANLIKNPFFESTNGKILAWGQREKGTIESSIDPTDSAPCGKINFTYFTEDKTMAKSNIFQVIENLTPGNYILSFSCSGKNLQALLAVVRFQKEAGFMNEDVLGKSENYYQEREMPQEGEWKRFVLNFQVPAEAAAGTLIIETFGESPDSGYALLKNVRLVKQED